MRLGKHLAQLLDVDKPLFGDFGPLDILPEEWWHSDCASTEFGIPPLLQPRQPGQEGPEMGGGEGPPAAAEVPSVGERPGSASGGRRPVAVAGFAVTNPQVGRFASVAVVQ